MQSDVVRCSPMQSYAVNRVTRVQAILEGISRVSINDMLWQTVPILQYPLIEKLTPDIATIYSSVMLIQH